MFELLEVLQHIIDEIDADPSADPGEVLDAIDWERVRRVLTHHRSRYPFHALGGTLREE